MRRTGRERFPPGAPWDFVFESRDGLPRNSRDWAFLKRWIKDYGERLRSGEFDEDDDYGLDR